MSEKQKGTKTEKWDEVNGGASGEILEAFLSSESDGYAILQLNHSREAREIQFLSYEYAESHGYQPQINLYDAVYAGSVDAKVGDDMTTLHNLFMKFNIDRPEDFTGHSLSVSDVIALKKQDEVKYYFVDSFGFKELPGFNSGRNPLRGIEDMIEQNDNQLDGVINNLPETTVAEKEAKTSVLDKLKVPAEDGHKKPRTLCPEMER